MLRKKYEVLSGERRDEEIKSSIHRSGGTEFAFASARVDVFSSMREVESRERHMSRVESKDGTRRNFSLDDFGFPLVPPAVSDTQANIFIASVKVFVIGGILFAIATGIVLGLAWLCFTHGICLSQA